MSEILRIESICKTYRRRGREPVYALRDVCLRLHSGDLHFVYGPSGSGKSTLLLCAGGLLHPETGTVAFDGRNIYELSSEERSILRARNMGFVFQQFHLIPYLNVLDNVLAPALAGTGYDGDLRPRAEELIEYFGLSRRRDHPPAELSVGERQRVALARALLHRPRLLLADEPTGNLDTQNGELVLEYLSEFARAGGAVLVVTHDRRIKADVFYHLEDGVLTEKSDCS